jgi:hypothetical protein
MGPPVKGPTLVHEALDEFANSIGPDSFLCAHYAARNEPFLASRQSQDRD